LSIGIRIVAGSGVTAAQVWTARILVQNDCADVGLQSRESPVTNPGAAIGDGTQERTFASIGETNKTNVGKEFEFKLDCHGDSFVALGSKDWARMSPGGEVRIA
jgi:hypothetical protein